MDVQVGYRVRTGPDRFAGEDEAIAAQLPEEFAGRLVFGVGDAEAFVEDGFVPLVAACFQAVTQLSTGTWFEGWLSSTPGEYRLDADGEALVLSGSAVLGPAGTPTSLSAPRGPLLAALGDCGRRGLALLHARGADPEVLEGLDGLDAEAAVASGSRPG